jgi:G3E family GTPase
MSARLPVTVLTGFLGSGKTTLLQRLLDAPGMKRTAVLINELGEVALDHLLVRHVEGGAVLLRNGCLCCTLKSDLQQGLRDIVDGVGTGRLPPSERIVVETTGLADPAPIAHTLLADPMLRHQLQLSTIVATIDAVHGAAQLERRAEPRRQAAMADRLVITKTDIAPPGAIAALRARLARINPTARLFEAQAGGFSPAALLAEGVADPETRAAEVQQWLAGAPEAADGQRHHHHHEHDHAGEGAVRSISLRLEQAIDWTAFGVWLTSLLHCHGPRVLRLKGLLNVEGAPSPVVLHAVQSVIHPPTHLKCWPDGDRASRLVFIVEDLDPATVRRALEEFLAAAGGGGLAVA